MKKIRNSVLLKSTGIYTISGILNGSIIFILMPFLTRYLTLEEYGIVAIFRTLGGFVFPIVAFYTSINRQYFDRDEIDFPRFLWNSIFIVFVNTVFISIIIFIFSEQLYNLTKFPSNWLWAVVLFAFFKAFTEIILSLYRVQQKPIAFGLFQITLTFINVTLALILVIYFIGTWRGAIIGDVVSYGIFALISIMFLIKKGRLKYSLSKDYIKFIFAYNIPIVFHLISKSVITMSDKIFITKMVGMDATGLYAAGYQIGMIIFVVTTAFQNAWLPFFYEKLKLENILEEKKIIKYIYIYMVLVLFFAGSISLIAKPFIKIFLGKSFEASSQFVVWIAFGFAFNGIYAMLASFITYIKKTYYLAIITIVSAFTNLALNYLLILKNGTIGAAQSTTITFVLMSLLTWLVALKIYKMPWFSFNSIRA